MAGDCGRQGGALDKPQGSRASCLDLNVALLFTGYDLGQYVERGRLEGTVSWKGERRVHTFSSSSLPSMSPATP